MTAHSAPSVHPVDPAPGEASDSSRPEDRKPAHSRARRYGMLALKVMVTLALIGWIAFEVDWSRFWQEVVSINLWIVGLVLGIRFLGLAFSAAKWQQLLAVHEVHYPLKTLCRWYLSAVFFKQFLPSVIGGDSYKVYKTYHNPRGRACAVLAVFMERITGLAAMMLICYAGAIVSYQLTGHWLSWVVMWGGTIGILAAVLGGFAGYYFNLLGRVARWRRCPASVRSLIHFSSDYRGHPRQLLIAGAYSFAFHLTRIGMFWLLLLACGELVSFIDLSVAVPVSNIAGMIPISLAGWGLIEGTFLGIMGQYGLHAAPGLTALLVIRVMTFFIASVGAVLYWITPADDAPPRAEGTAPVPGSAS